MIPPDHPEAELRRRILERKAVLVVGTGVSMAASIDPATGKPHPQASWAGLLEHGLQHGLQMTRLTRAKVDAYRKLLEIDPATHNYISVAAAITSAFGGAQSTIFKEWLADTVGKIAAHDRSALDSLDALRQHGNLLATTNYDSLLLGPEGNLVPITWNDNDAFLGAARGERRDAVIFLHGHWETPASVVLDWKSYEEISRDEAYRADLAAFWKMTTWVYVGCGVNGLSDPDFGLLLERHGERARNANHWDFCLVRKKDQKLFQKHFDDNKLNIRAISIGADHSDLPTFLRSLLPTPVAPVNTVAPMAPVAARDGNPIPQPPAFYASPDYIGRTTFIGRKAQLQTLGDWAQPVDKSSVLLFEAIGGNGKSMLTWHWAKDDEGKYATVCRPADRPWAGRFWYSFYEKGAVMRQFCQRALAYMKQKPLEAFEKESTPEMREALLTELHEKPWLLILDGLERVLVAYHRIDAAEVRDEDLNRPTDKILHRDPCDAIRDEDTDLLRALAAAAPSKILISSRLLPRALLSPAGLPLPGVRPLVLPGLDEADAEALLRSCGVQGTSADIRYYLTNYCGNHPLVIGVLAGLINSPGPHRGNFDAWAADPAYGAMLDLASLDLIQRRNHILQAAMDALEPASRQLLSTLALLSSAVDYETVAAFSPHLPPELEEVKVPMKPEEYLRWKLGNEKVKANLRDEYEAALAKRKAYEQALREWQASDALREAPTKLSQTISDLEHRGLLQYDPREQRYDLHPVVRGVAAGSLREEDKERYGQKVVDHFNSQPHSPYEQAKAMADVESGLHVVRTLLKLGHHREAAKAFRGELSVALACNLEAHVEILALLRPLFPTGWDQLPKDVDASTGSYLANSAGIALDESGEPKQAIGAYAVALRVHLESENGTQTCTNLSNIAGSLSDQNQLARALRLSALALDLVSAIEDEEHIFRRRLDVFAHQSRVGRWLEAESTWYELDPMGRRWSRVVYRQGYAEWQFAKSQFWQGRLMEEHLTTAATLAEQDHNRSILRWLHWLRGAWRLEQGEWALAAASFTHAVTMAREVRLVDEESETGLALAKVRLHQLTGDEARGEAQRLAGLRKPAHGTLSRLWQALGDLDQAKHHALAAYTWAWADGEPYVNRYELTETTELLHELGVSIPNLPPYDPAKDEPFPWEADVRAAIEKLRAEKAAKEESKQQGPV